jgi:uncharacterized protein with HEPN domain
MAKHHDVKYLGDIVDFGGEARTMVEGVSLDEFLANRQMQLALAHLVQIIGEAAYKLPAESREQMPDVPWPTSSACVIGWSMTTAWSVTGSSGRRRWMISNR